MPRGQNRIDLTLQTFGRLWVLNREPSDAGGRARWLCVCECGNKVIVRGICLRAGRRQSCGCLQVETQRRNRDQTRHGHARKGGPSPTYITWKSMLQRCNDPNATGYERYGGRGIKVCARWLVFESFLSDMGERPEGRSLDRRDNEKGYEKSNCRWATRLEQRHNRRLRRSS